MPLFACDECDSVENTACCRYWLRKRATGGRALCSQCDPEIGEWHGRFERQQYDPCKHAVVNR
jgi:hypothetical protein